VPNRVDLAGEQVEGLPAEGREVLVHGGERWGPQPVEDVVPDEQADQDRRRRQHRRQHRQHDPAEHAQRAGAVDPRRLLQLHR
jgi:hypothetical protein